ncbi:MAG: diacylglycerol kinase family protein [Spirochaetia bacterium]|jgi:diacylglycerol kinase family enzyme|nr:diacylglycerol kinase family protein [Spirochaetia bacterium]
MDTRAFAEAVRGLVERTPLFGKSDLEAVMVANPKAGGFSRRSRARHNATALADAAKAASGMQLRQGTTNWRALDTASPKHAGAIALSLLEEAAIKPKTGWLVILACGDGTSHEFLDELSRAPRELANRFTVLRLPMGTGNDGSDGRELPDALSRLIGYGRIDEQVAIRMIPAPGGPASTRAPGGEWRSFNIASLGVDAYITHMTNKLKAAMPGDSYKMWLDIAAVLYDLSYPSGHMEIRAFDATGQPMASYEGKFLLAAMGISGKRTYGSNKPILPGDENVCLIRQMSLLRKLILKGPIAAGHHRGLPEAELFTADALEISYSHPILMQTDGEAQSLVAEDFPFRMERTGPLIRHVARIQGKRPEALTGLD